ncbi:MAG: hypothetical protein IPO32_20040 [Crocinitomicaceae bacterium]|nr:hypothetical protein [Crocinitomicaceae bacterium]
MNVKIFFGLILLNASSLAVFSQESSENIISEPATFTADANTGGGYVTESFASIRVLNNHSVEMIPKNNLEFIVAHKFGDIAGSRGGVQNWFGFDNLADVRIAFEYGITNNMNIGLGRSKGIGLLNQVADGYFKYAILKQKYSAMPVSLNFVTALSIPYAKATTDSTSITSYPTFAHRMIYTTQILIARKFSDRITLQANVGYNHRNYVHYSDQNGLFFAGLSGRFRFTKTLGILFEYNHILERTPDVNYTNHLAFGFEILTGGHAFCLMLSNSTGVTENLFIPGTTEDWLQGQFRFGFSINRRFKL